MLNTGIEVLGIFVYCYSTDEKNACMKKINTIMSNTFSHDEDEETKEGEKMGH